MPKSVTIPYVFKCVFQYIPKGLAGNQYTCRYQNFNLLQLKLCIFPSILHYTLYVLSLPAEMPIAPAIIGTHCTAYMDPRDANGGMAFSTMPRTSRRHPRTIRVIPETHPTMPENGGFHKSSMGWIYCKSLIFSIHYI